MRTYQLVPLEPNSTWKVSAKVKVQDQNVIIQYLVIGSINQLSLPPKSVVPIRKDNLWKDTCFELFVKPSQGKSYSEINISPSSDWNVYEFEDYRQGMSISSRVDKINIVCELERDSFKCQFSLPKIILDKRGEALQIGLSCVLKHQNGKIDYWAIKHRGAKPDFHEASNFVDFKP